VRPHDLPAGPAWSEPGVGVGQRGCEPVGRHDQDRGDGYRRRRPAALAPGVPQRQGSGRRCRRRPLSCWYPIYGVAGRSRTRRSSWALSAFSAEYLRIVPGVLVVPAMFSMRAVAGPGASRGRGSRFVASTVVMRVRRHCRVHPGHPLSTEYPRGYRTPIVAGEAAVTVDSSPSASAMVAPMPTDPLLPGLGRSTPVVRACPAGASPSCDNRQRCRSSVPRGFFCCGRWILGRYDNVGIDVVGCMRAELPCDRE
jgi:hypothetical protein